MHRPDQPSTTVVVNVFIKQDVKQLIEIITAKKENNGFGIRYFLRDNPAVLDYLRHHPGFTTLLGQYFTAPTIIKSIYFDKPPTANWTVNWHQDITVNLTEKIDDPRFRNWRTLPDRVVAQPNPELLNAIRTFRIHLDDTDEHNGALSVVDQSEAEGIIRVDAAYLQENEHRKRTIRVDAGGVMLMRPLTVHASRRTKQAARRRRVLHLEVLEREEALRWPFVEAFSVHAGKSALHRMTVG